MKFKAKQNGYNVYTHYNYKIYEFLDNGQVILSQNNIWIKVILENIDCVKLAIKYEKNIGLLDNFGMEKITTKKVLENNLIK